MNTNQDASADTSAKISQMQLKKQINSVAGPAFKTNPELIRFEEKKERYIWAEPDKIVFVQSADHYVKALINTGNRLKWMSRHCTIKDLSALLPAGIFIRLNKFYLLNSSHFVHFNERDKILFLANDFSIPISHNISRYVLDLFKK